MCFVLIWLCWIGIWYGNVFRVWGVGRLIFFCCLLEKGFGIRVGCGSVWEWFFMIWGNDCYWYGVV